MKKVILLVLSALIFLAFYISNPGQKSVQASNGDKVRIIVGFKKITPAFIKESVVKSISHSDEENLLLPDTKVLIVSASGYEKVIKNLSRNFWVDFAEEDLQATADVTPNDTYFQNQWGLNKINAPDSWNVTMGSENVLIAILDTGVDYTHPDLLGKLSFSVNCTTSSCPSYWSNDPYGHGTHVAGIAAAVTNNNSGIAGVSGKSKLMSVKVLSDSGSGFYSWITNGIIWAADNGAKVINLSLGAGSSSTALEQAVDYAWNKGVLIVAAAGNGGSNTSFYPAKYSPVIAVAASDANDNKASFSNYGSSWVDVAAPGVSIFSTYKSDYSYLTGTSMAAPFVSGLGALVFSDNPGWTNTQVRQKIEQTSDTIPGSGTYWSFGRINACRALDCNSQIVPTLTPTPAPTSTPIVSVTPTPPMGTPTIDPSPTLILTPTLTPTPKPLPWWCAYVPQHYTCK